VVVFLNGLSPCLGATDATAGEVCEVLRKGLPIVQVGDALLLNRSVVQDNGNRHVVRPTTFIAEGTILYRAAELFVVSGIASCMPSFSCMRTRIVRCFGHSVKDKERAILATRPVANKFKNRICIFVALWICEKISRHSVCHFLRYAKSCVTNPLTENIRFRPNLLSGKQFWKSVWALRDTVHGLR
jgi:hypothetical protein